MAMCRLQHLCETTSHPLWMGIVNTTPDSFSDGGCYFNLDSALARCHELVQYGANILDFGGVSTNPKASDFLLSPEQELDRVYPVIRRVRREFADQVLISIDTYSPYVAHALAQEKDIDVINDIYAGQIQDHTYLSTMYVAAKFNLGFVVMHMGQSQHTIDFLQNRIAIAKKCGVPFVAIDPGIGYGRFGKDLDQILNLLSPESMQQLCDLDSPVLIGLSRKSFLADLYPELTHPQMRDKITKEFEQKCIENGAKIIRSHKMPSEKF